MDVIQLLLSLFKETGSAYCAIGGLAVNAYAEPVVSPDLGWLPFPIASKCWVSPPEAKE